MKTVEISCDLGEEILAVMESSKLYELSEIHLRLESVRVRFSPVLLIETILFLLRENNIVMHIVNDSPDPALAEKYTSFSHQYRVFFIKP